MYTTKCQCCGTEKIGAAILCVRCDALFTVACPFCTDGRRNGKVWVRREFRDPQKRCPACRNSRYISTWNAEKKREERS